MSQTIAAISTPPAPAGLGVIRLSGDEAVAVAARVFRPGRAERELTGLAGYAAAYGHVFDEEGDIDDCVALVFRAPHSYTGEDVVELSCHGGLYLLRRVLRAVLAAGARPAGAGGPGGKPVPADGRGQKRAGGAVGPFLRLCGLSGRGYSRAGRNRIGRRAGPGGGEPLFPAGHL